MAEDAAAAVLGRKQALRDQGLPEADVRKDPEVLRGAAGTAIISRIRLLDGKNNVPKHSASLRLRAPYPSAQ